MAMGLLSCAPEVDPGGPLGVREGRADFWIAFSNVIPILVPMIFAMQFPHGSESIVFQRNNQLKWAFSGLVASVMGLYEILRRFIRQ